MVSYIQGWFQPASPQGLQAQRSSFYSDSIVALALGALALFSANAFNRTNPNLATMLRCVAGEIGLIWLFKSCCPTSTQHQGHYPVVPGPVIPAASPPAHSQWNWWPWPNGNQLHAAPVYGAAPVVQPIPIPHSPFQQAHINYSHSGLQGGVPQVHPTHSTGFPTVHRAPAQPDPRLMNQAPLTRQPVQPVAGLSIPLTAPQQFPFNPRQAHTNYQSTAPHVAYAMPHPQENKGGFPTVHRAPAQPDLRPMNSAPSTRHPTTQTFSTGKTFSQRESFPNSKRSKGNERPMFQATT